MFPADPASEELFKTLATLVSMAVAFLDLDEPTLRFAQGPLPFLRLSRFRRDPTERGVVQMNHPFSPTTLDSRPAVMVTGVEMAPVPPAPGPASTAACV